MTSRPGGMDVVVGAGHFALAMENTLATTASRSDWTPCKLSLRAIVDVSTSRDKRERACAVDFFANSQSLHRVSQHPLVVGCVRFFL